MPGPVASTTRGRKKQIPVFIFLLPYLGFCTEPHISKFSFSRLSIACSKSRGVQLQGNVVLEKETAEDSRARIRRCYFVI